MVTLGDISIFDLYVYSYLARLSDSIECPAAYESIFNILRSNNIVSYQDLKVLISKLKDNNEDWVIIRELQHFLTFVETNIQRMGNIDFVPHIFKFPGYISTENIKISERRQIDEKYTANVLLLPFNSPFSSNDDIAREGNMLLHSEVSSKLASIHELRHQLSWASANNPRQNWLMERRGVGVKSCETIALAIRRFDEQVDRLAEAAPNGVLEGFDKFNYHLNDRSKIVTEILTVLAGQFMEMATEKDTIWGPLSKSKKRALTALTKSTSSLPIKQNFIETVSLYATLKELLNCRGSEEARARVLSRFLVN